MEGFLKPEVAAPPDKRNTADSRPTRTEGIGVGLLFWLIVIAVLGLYRSPVEKLIESDPNLYVAGARSLAAGTGYHLTEIAGNPPITLYPPGMSLFLTPAWLGAPDFVSGIYRMDWLMILTGWSTGMGTWLLGRWLGLTRSWGMLIGLAALMEPTTLRLISNFWSEPLMAAGLVAAGVTCVARSRLQGLSTGTVAGHLIALTFGSFLAASLLARTASLPLVAMALLCVITHRSTFHKWERISVFGPVIIAMGAWKFHTLGQASYEGAFVEEIQRQGIQSWILSGLGELGRLVSGHYWAQSILSPSRILEALNLPGKQALLVLLRTVEIAVGIAITAGIAILWRITSGWGRWFVVGLVLYIVQMAVWPWRLEARGAIPIYWAILLGAALSWCHIVHRRAWHLADRVAQCSLALLLSGSIVVHIYFNHKGRSVEARRIAEFDRFVEQVEETVPPHTGILIAQQVPFQNMLQRMNRKLHSRDRLFLGPPQVEGFEYAIYAISELGDRPPDIYFSERILASENGWWFLHRTTNSAGL